ncbi:MAG: DUF1648 domain-containing protein [Bacteroidia bacterium]|nr:DUF1648 domain-containing protein [Bacteroidia bacterium]
MKVKLDTADKVSEVISIAFILSSVCLVCFSLPKLPDVVPIHFNLSGQPDGYGSKYTLIVVSLIALPIYALMTYLSLHPKFYEYRMNKNMPLEEQYKMSSKMARSIKLVLMPLFFAITFFMLKSAKEKSIGTAEMIWLSLFIPLIFSVIIYWIVKWEKKFS